MVWKEIVFQPSSRLLFLYFGASNSADTVCELLDLNTLSLCI